jgi:hypothetical protein
VRDIGSLPRQGVTGRIRHLAPPRLPFHRPAAVRWPHRPQALHLPHRPSALHLPQRPSALHLPQRPPGLRWPVQRRGAHWPVAWVDLAWVVFSLANLAAIVIFAHWEAVTFHLI